MNHIDTMKLALEALDWMTNDSAPNPKIPFKEIANILRTAIEQAEKQDFRGARLVLTSDGVKQDGWMGDQPAAPLQERKPVCWDGEDKCPNRQACCDAQHCLYTAAPAAQPAVPLTDEQIIQAKAAIKGTLDVQFVQFARAIEAAHGIKGDA